jgi:hypothetical protein
MFIGHYGPSFAGNALKRSIPLWVLFLAVQWLEATPHGDFRAVTQVGNVVLRKISRAEVARFVLDELEPGRYLHQMPFIGHEN